MEIKLSTEIVHIFSFLYMLSCSEKAVKNSQVGAWAGLFKHQVYFAFIEMFCTAHIGFQIFCILE